MATTVRPSSTADRERSRCRAARGSRRLVASSSTKVCGSTSTSLASASCWAWGGESGCPVVPSSVSSPSGSASAHSRASTASSASRSSASVARGLREPQVVGERADEDVVLLGDERDVAAQLVELEVDESDAADGHRARARPVDAGEQASERGLAGARGTDDGDALASRERQVDPVEHVVALTVRVADVVGLDALVDRLLAGRRPVVLDERHADEAGHRRRADLELVQPRDDRGRRGPSE